MANVLEIVIQGTDKASKTLGGISSQIDEMGKKMQIAGALMVGAGTAIAGIMWKMTDSYTKAGEEIYNMSLRTGIGVEALSELKYMAEQSGSSLESMETSIRAMQRGLLDATMGTGQANLALLRLGLSVQSIMAMKPEDQFWTIANRLAGIEDPTRRAALAMDLFGKSGTDLLPILAEGEIGIEAMKQKAHDLGVVFTEESAVAAKDFQDAMSDLKTAMMGLGGAIAKAIMPSLEDLIEKVTFIVAKFSEWAKVNPGLITIILGISAALIGFGVAIAIIGSVARTIVAVNAALMIMNALLGPAGWANLAAAGIAIVAAAGMVWGINKLLMPENTGFLGFQHGGIVPGPIGQPIPIIAHGGEMFMGEGMMPSQTVIVNVHGSVIAERDLAEVIRQVFYDIRRHNVSLEMA